MLWEGIAQSLVSVSDGINAVAWLPKKLLLSLSMIYATSAEWISGKLGCTHASLAYKLVSRQWLVTHVSHWSNSIGSRILHTISGRAQLAGDHGSACHLTISVASPFRLCADILCLSAMLMNTMFSSYTLHTYMHLMLSPCLSLRR